MMPVLVSSSSGWHGVATANSVSKGNPSCRTRLCGVSIFNQRDIGEPSFFSLHKNTNRLNWCSSNIFCKYQWIKYIPLVYGPFCFLRPLEEKKGGNRSWTIPQFYVWLWDFGPPFLYIPLLSHFIAIT